MTINVREAESKDIVLICDYWINSSSEHLVGMGVDLKKMPTRDQIKKALTEQIESKHSSKLSYALIWEIDNQPIGHCNINQIVYGERANMHLHLWHNSHRKKGAGTVLVKKSLPFYFENFKLDFLDCEPYTLNPAPNKLLERVGFKFVKTHKTIPGSINFEQSVNLWRLTKEKYQEAVK